MIIIREVRIHEIDKVYEIACRCFTERYLPELFYNIYSSWPNAFLVADINGKIVGFIAGSKLSSIEGRILLLAVEAPYRRRGIGTRLLEKFLNICLTENIKQVRLEVREDNYEAIRFYMNRGFVITSRIPHYYTDGTNAYVMVKVLEKIFEDT